MSTLIINADIIDGTGSKAFKGDVFIKNGRIEEVFEGGIPAGKRPLADEVIDAGGLTLTPGFIDVHRHADAAVFRPDFGEIELHQGLTTIINGNCGLSIVPCPDDQRKEITGFLSPVIGETPEYAQISDFKEYMDALPETLPLNVGMLIGNGTVRSAVSGYRGGKLSDEEYKKAGRYLERAIENGAYGVSIGLQYAPEFNYNEDDLVRVLEPMRGSDIPLVTHTRGDGDSLFESLNEVINIAKRLNIRLEVSHFKNMGKKYWGSRALEGLKVLDAAREEGLDVNTDVYPYTYGSTQLIHILPPSFLKGGMQGAVELLSKPEERKKLTKILEEGEPGFENLLKLLGFENFYLTTFNTEKNQKYTGLSVPTIAEIMEKDPYDCVYTLLCEEQGKIGMIDYLAGEEDVRTIMKYPHAMFISDSTYPSKGLPHPRVYGTFPRILETYVRDEKVLDICEAVHKMTGMPAQIYRLRGKGLIKKGMDADICLFDPKKTGTKATPTDPKQFGYGFSRILIGGVTVLKDDVIIKRECGRKLRRT